MSPSILSEARRNIKHAVTASIRVQQQLVPIHVEYELSHPGFAHSVLMVIKYADGLQECIKQLDDLLMELK